MSKIATEDALTGMYFIQLADHVEGGKIVARVRDGVYLTQDDETVIYKLVAVEAMLSPQWSFFVTEAAWRPIYDAVKPNAEKA